MCSQKASPKILMLKIKLFLDRSGKETSGAENLKDFNNLMKEIEYV